MGGSGQSKEAIFLSGRGFKIAIGGKGGVGKTTVCAIWARLFADAGYEVLAIDADANATLCSAFGISDESRPRALTEMRPLIAGRTGTDGNAVGAYFRLNPQVSDIPAEHSVEVDGLKLLVLGGPMQTAGGCACAEGAFLRAMMREVVLNRDEVVIIDLAAGVEFMGRASVEGIDALVLVVEPGRRSIDTANHLAAMARQLGIRTIAALANKITADEQIDMIAAQLRKVPFLGGSAYSNKVQASDLENRPVFSADQELVDSLARAKGKLLDIVSPESRLSAGSLG